MSESVHSTLIFCGGIMGILTIIVCLWCITYCRREASMKEVEPSIDDDENSVYTIINVE